MYPFNSAWHAVTWVVVNVQTSNDKMHTKKREKVIHQIIIMISQRRRITVARAYHHNHRKLNGHRLMKLFYSVYIQLEVTGRVMFTPYLPLVVSRLQRLAFVIHGVLPMYNFGVSTSLHPQYTPAVSQCETVGRVGYQCWNRTSLTYWQGVASHS